MNTFDIYLKGGQVVTVETAHTFQDLIEFVYCEDEREILLSFKDLTIVKSHISAIKDVTKTKRSEKNPYEHLIFHDVPIPYKPWEEQK
jgi:hypothetical protein